MRLGFNFSLKKFYSTGPWQDSSSRRLVSTLADIAGQFSDQHQLFCRFFLLRPKKKEDGRKSFPRIWSKEEENNLVDLVEKERKAKSKFVGCGCGCRGSVVSAVAFHLDDPGSKPANYRHQIVRQINTHY